MTLHLDCTYTRLQPGNIGITRVVRGLATALASPGVAPTGFAPVAYHSCGFRRLPDGAFLPSTSGGDCDRTSLRAFRVSGNLRLRGLIKATTPVRWQVAAWKGFSRITFDRLAAPLPEVRFAAGDVLFLADASWNYDVWSGAARARDAGARVVTMVHDLTPINHPQYCAPAVSTIFEAWIRGALARSDAIVCNSQATQEEVEGYCRAHGLACPPISSFRLGGDLPLPVQDNSPIRPGLRPDSHYFLTVGTLEPQKNHALILDALEEYWRLGGTASWCVVGRPGNGTAAVLERLRGHAALGRRLFLIVDANDAELDFLYRHTVALIFASGAEGFGLPLVEARQRGAAVIASRIPAFRELADDGVRFFAPGRADELCQRLRERMERPDETFAALAPFTWRDSSRQLLERITGLLPEAGPRP